MKRFAVFAVLLTAVSVPAGAFAPTAAKSPAGAAARTASTTQSARRIAGAAPSALSRKDPRKMMRPTPSASVPSPARSPPPAPASALRMTESSETPTQTDDASGVWLPQLRKVMGGIALAGAVETAYLTANKIIGNGQVALCGTDTAAGGGGGCNDVLNGPYAYIPYTEIPLAAVGFVAYVTVAALALSPVLTSSDRDSQPVDDTLNRVLLTTLTTAMGTFSVFLMTILFGVLQQECPFCVFSAVCSVLLAKLAWIGGCLPDQSKVGARATGVSFLASIAAAIVLFVSVDENSVSNANSFPSILASSSAATARTPAAGTGTGLYSPPPITTTSSQRALELSTNLATLDAKMYGAYWCSHCYDQKEVFGKEAFANIAYVECSKDGVNSQSKLCRAKDIPGYPTWEIDGKLYPGEQLLDELEDIVANAGKN